MNSQKGYEKVYETIMRSPGMEEEVKITLKVPRKAILLLSQLIDQGATKDGKSELFSAGEMEGLKSLEAEMLAQGKFSPEFVENWRELTANKTAG